MKDGPSSAAQTKRREYKAPLLLKKKPLAKLAKQG